MAAASQAASHPAERKILSFPHCPTAAALRRRETLAAAERVDLDRLRWMALRSRLAPRPDLERACFLLASESGASFERFAIAFFRGLDARARGAMVFYRPGTATVGDDELWLMRLVAAMRRGEDAGAAALIAWRVEPAARRWMRFLASGMARALGPAAAAPCDPPAPAAQRG